MMRSVRKTVSQTPLKMIQWALRSSLKNEMATGSMIMLASSRTSITKSQYSLYDTNHTRARAIMSLVFCHKQVHKHGRTVISCFYRATRMHSADYGKMSVCLSVTRQCSVETAKRIVKIFLPSGRHTILVFPHQTLWHIPTGTPLTGRWIKRVWKKSMFISEMMQHRPVVTIECEQEIWPKLSNGTIFNDLEWLNPDFKVTILFNVK